MLGSLVKQPNFYHPAHLDPAILRDQMVQNLLQRDTVQGIIGLRINHLQFLSGFGEKSDFIPLLHN